MVIVPYVTLFFHKNVGIGRGGGGGGENIARYLWEHSDPFKTKFGVYY